VELRQRVMFSIRQVQLEITQTETRWGQPGQD
jgi:hypothetical protein